MEGYILTLDISLPAEQHQTKVLYLPVCVEILIDLSAFLDEKKKTKTSSLSPSSLPELSVRFVCQKLEITATTLEKKCLGLITIGLWNN